MTIKENLSEIKARIAKAVVKSGRNPKNIVLVAVTKKSTVEEIEEVISCGISAIGENRVEFAAKKFVLFSENAKKAEKHMIGHLQTNKVKAAVQLFDVIQSVDSLKLANEIDKRAGDIKKVMSIMIEINISCEDQKFGINPEDLDELYDELLKLSNVKVIGLMAMAPFVPAEETRPYFRHMKQIFDKYNQKSGLKWLSMGMTNDFEVAIEEGANMVRVGTAIFGE